MDDEQYEAQERWQGEMSAYLDRVMKTARSSPHHAGAELKYETRELVVFGVGEPPEELVAVIEQAPAAIRVSWREAPHSGTELTLEVQRIMDAHPGRLTSGASSHEGTGLLFTTTDRLLLEARDPQSALGARYPVTIEYGEPPVAL